MKKTETNAYIIMTTTERCPKGKRIFDVCDILGLKVTVEPKKQLLVLSSVFGANDLVMGKPIVQPLSLVQYVQKNIQQGFGLRKRVQKNW